MSVKYEMADRLGPIWAVITNEYLCRPNWNEYLIDTNANVHINRHSPSPPPSFSLSYTPYIYFPTPHSN